jgi:pSer/pThr/pTyr-binding forkhead associated (FHA) protein
MIADESVSRIHALIYINSKNKIAIKDCGSKFGTMLKHIPNESTIGSNLIPLKNPLCFQLGKIVFTIDKRKKT